MNTTPKNIREEAWEEFNNTPPNPTSLFNINPNHCKFHLDNTQDVSDSNTLFCGKPRWINYSWCKWHFIIAHDIKK